MKVLFINNGMTHYYNLVLNRLNSLPGTELVLVVPENTIKGSVDGVFQTKEGISFRVHELEEVTVCKVLTTFKGLASVLWHEKPDIVMVGQIHLYSFLLHPAVVLVMKMLGAKVILKSHPFRLADFFSAKKSVCENPPDLPLPLPSVAHRCLRKLGFVKLIRGVDLLLRKLAFQLPDAHVNYVDEAKSIYGSYGVPAARIHVTGNSPDTDLLLKVRESLVSASSPPPLHGFRLIHVGRLVAWKRVDLLLHAVQKLSERFAKIECLVVGTGPEEETLKSVAAKLGIDKRVSFLGGVYDPVVLGTHLMSSRIYVLAGMGGISINEAMCFGLPVVCSVCDGTEKKLVRDGFNGLFFKDGDLDDLVGKLSVLLGDPAQCESMGRHSLEIIRNEINIHSVIRGYQRAFRFVLPDNSTCREWQGVDI